MVKKNPGLKLCTSIEKSDQKVKKTPKFFKSMIFFFIFLIFIKKKGLILYDYFIFNFIFFKK